MNEQTFTLTDQNWFAVSEPSRGVFAICEPLHSETVLSYLVCGSRRALLIDTGMGVGNIADVVDRLTDLPVIVVNSHSHWDHIGGNMQFESVQIHHAEIAGMNADILTRAVRRAMTTDHLRGPLPGGVRVEHLNLDPGRVGSTLTGGERFDLGDREIEVLYCPGHSPGLLAFIDAANGVLFSTDVVYPGDLYAQFDGCDLVAYQTTLDNLVSLSAGIRTVHPSHNRDTMSADLLIPMREAFAEVMRGRRPDLVDHDAATHRFEGFGIKVSPEFRGLHV
ncbi:MBL fold metallo-hydrolase [soil metagenome]